MKSNKIFILLIGVLICRASSIKSDQISAALKPQDPLQLNDSKIELGKEKPGLEFDKPSEFIKKVEKLEEILLPKTILSETSDPQPQATYFNKISDSSKSKTLEKKTGLRDLITKSDRKPDTKAFAPEPAFENSKFRQNLTPDIESTGGERENTQYQEVNRNLNDNSQYAQSDSLVKERVPFIEKEEAQKSSENADSHRLLEFNSEALTVPTSRPPAPSGGPIPVITYPEQPNPPRLLKNDEINSQGSLFSNIEENRIEARQGESAADSINKKTLPDSNLKAPSEVENLNMAEAPAPKIPQESVQSLPKKNQNENPKIFDSSSTKPSVLAGGPLPVIKMPDPAGEPKHPQTQSESYLWKKESSKSQKSDPIISTKRKSWGKKLEESLYLCIFGVILFFFSFPVLWFNERRKVETDKVIKDGFNECTEIGSDKNSLEHDGKLVCVSGPLKTDERILDSATGFSVSDAVKLVRIVELFQNVETKHSSSQRDTFGGGETITTEYRYHQEWSQTFHDGSTFQNPNKRNPNKSAWLYEGENFKARNVRLGAFLLNSSQIERINTSEIAQISPSFLTSANEEFLNRIQSHSIDGKRSNVNVDGNYIYIRYGNDMGDGVGDMRISYRVVKTKEVTVVAQQQGESFTTFRVGKQKGKSPNNNEENGRLVDNNDGDLDNDGINVCCPCCPCCLSCACVDKCMKAPNTIDWVYENRLGKVRAFKEQENNNQTITWIIRLLGFLMMFGGIYLFFSPLIELLQALPLLSTVGSIVVGVFAFLVAFPLTILTISLAWLFYRPLLGILLILVAVPFIVILSKALSGAKDASETVTPSF